MQLFTLLRSPLHAFFNCPRAFKIEISAAFCACSKETSFITFPVIIFPSTVIGSCPDIKISFSDLLNAA